VLRFSFAPIRRALRAPFALTRSTYYHLYADIAWYGLLAGSSLAFASIYITRLGATAWQIGLLNAGPALVGLLFTLPAGRWLHERPIGKAVLTTAILQRGPYLLWFLLPLLVAPQSQIWSYIILTLLMTIPGTALSVGFNALYAAAVPPEQRGRVAGIRNAMLSVVYILTSLACGFILDTFPLETGYAIVFLLGFVGAVGSTAHVWFLRGIRGDAGIEPGQVRAPTGDFARPGSMRFLGISLRSSVALRAFARGTKLLRPEIMATRYGGVVGALFFFHFAQYLPIALFPILWVQMLHLTDKQISVGTAFFHAMVLLGSLQLGRLTYRKGNLWIMVAGIVGLSLYPLINALAGGLALYLVASVVGGLAWSLVGGALANYLLDLAPVHDRPAYLSWYNMALNAGILLGSLAGPLLGQAIGVKEALLAGFVLRLAAGGLLWIAGRAAKAPHLHPVEAAPPAKPAQVAPPSAVAAD
jgi:MFS family permease